MKVALAQVNPTVGDLPGNVALCLAAIERAGALGADLVLFPEMVLPGYPPRDILHDPTFVEAVQAAAADLAVRARGGPPALVGSIAPAGRQPPRHPGLWNVALRVADGAARPVAAKQLLPIYDVFHEPRWFLPGPAPTPLALGDRSLGILICEDLWDDGYERQPAALQLAAGADLLVVMAASPFRHGILAERQALARRHPCPVLFVNLVGGNDELIFDGRSFALGAAGQVLSQSAGFAEDLQLVDLSRAPNEPDPDETPLRVPGWSAPRPRIDAKGRSPAAPVENREHAEATAGGAGRNGGAEPPFDPAIVFTALTLGVRDFTAKNGLNRAYLGLSGGIDSAVVAIVAAAALGPDNVTAVALPGPYTDRRSTDCARELAAALKIQFEVRPVTPLYEAAKTALPDMMAAGTTAENVQARLRALILMSYVNSYGGLLLNCSNKTELALGYATLYGDMAGGLCPIGDLTKVQVKTLARWLNVTQTAIPPFILTRAPTAELGPGQIDPFDYDVVAPALEVLVAANQSDGALRRSEHKRWQMGVILKVTATAFGSGRLMPITRR